MSAGVFTPELRFKWVKGEVTTGAPSSGFVACGPGTAFPMEATLDQLAELFYRVKDAKWTSGSFLNSFGAGPPSVSHTFTEVAPSAALFEHHHESLGDEYNPRSNVAFSNRGYSTTNNYDDIEAVVPMSEYGDAIFSTNTIYAVQAGGLGAYHNSGWSRTVSCREAVSEYALWAEYGIYDGGADVPFDFGTTSGTYATTDGFRTGFSITSSSYIATDDYGYAAQTLPIYCFHAVSPAGGYANFELVFSGLVAWVDNDASGNPFSPGNRMFVGVNMFVDYAPTLQAGSDHVDSGSLLKLKLSGDENFLTAPIYVPYEEPSEGYDILNYYSTDWIFEATEWWPYDRNAIPRQIWDANTGEKVPVGAPHAAFNIEANQDQIFHMI